MNFMIQMSISVILCVLAGVLEYLYLSKQKILCTKKVIAYLAIIQVVIAAGLLYRFRGEFESIYLKILRLFILFECMALVTVTDYIDNIIPNHVLLGALGIRFAILVPEFVTLNTGVFELIIQHLVACIIPLTLLILGLFIMKNSIGMGDVKLLFIIAFYTDFVFIFNTLFNALLVALIVIIVMFVTKKKKAKDTIAFAPFLLIGAYLSVLLNVV